MIAGRTMNLARSVRGASPERNVRDLAVKSMATTADARSDRDRSKRGVCSVSANKGKRDTSERTRDKGAALGPGNKIAERSRMPNAE